MFKIIVKSDRATTYLKTLSGKLSSHKEFFVREVRPLLIEEITTVFDEEGNPAWPPLNPDYEARKFVQYPGKTILRRTDRLFTSYTRVAAEGNLSEISDFALQHGTNIPYAAYHEFGTTRVPHRPILGAIAEDSTFSDKLKRALEQWLIEQLSAN